MVEQSANQSTGVMKKFPKSQKNSGLILGVFSVLVILAGIVTGYFVSTGRTSGTSGVDGNVAPGAEESATEAGLSDESTFRDSAEGVLEIGGINGEGTHYLSREGGETQNVYLTSTVIDLDQFEGKKVIIWGETITARSAPWLMDVGRIKVTN